jgi:nitrogen fixation protein NifB
VDPQIGKNIYSWIRHENEVFWGEEAAKILIEHQLESVELASDLGLLVKVNTVLVPGVNSSHVTEIARGIKKRGAHLMNIMPLISCGKFKCVTPPSAEEIRAARNECENIIPQFTVCKQCRADVCGIPGIDDKTISEILSPVELG